MLRFAPWCLQALVLVDQLARPNRLPRSTLGRVLLELAWHVPTDYTENIRPLNACRVLLLLGWHVPADGQGHVLRRVMLLFAREPAVLSGSSCICSFSRF